MPGEPRGYPLCHWVEKGDGPLCSLKPEAATKASNRRSRGCPGFNKAAASGRRSSDVPSQARKQKEHVAPRRPTHRLVGGGGGAANKPRSVSGSRRQSGHQVEEKTSLV